MFIFDVDRPYDELVGLRDLRGSMNGRRYKARVNRRNAEENLAELQSYNRLRSSRFSEFGLLDLGEGISCFYYQTGETLEDFRPRTMDEAQTLIGQMLEGLEILHCREFVHRSITPKGFIVEYKNGSLDLKIDISLCVEAEASAVTYRGNVEDVSDLLIGSLYRFLPERKEVKLYGQELKALATTLSYCRRLTNFPNHPFFWSSERRILFYQHLYEISHGLYKDGKTDLHWNISSINIRDDLGKYYFYLPESVCLDLQVEKGNHVADALFLLRRIRIFSVHTLPKPWIVLHGNRHYKGLGYDNLSSFDIYLAYKAPSLFMNLYDVASKHLLRFDEFDRFLVDSIDVARVPPHPVPFVPAVVRMPVPPVVPESEKSRKRDASKQGEHGESPKLKRKRT